MKTNIFLFFVFLFFLGIGSVIGYRVWHTAKRESEHFIPKKTSFDLNPPANALVGNIATISGEVKKKGRESEEFKKIEVNQRILQGERLATGIDGRTMVEFKDFVSLSLSPSSEIAFVSLLPSHFLINQTSGKVNYQLNNSSNSVSVRSLSLLFILEEGIAGMAMDNGMVTIELKKGDAKLAMVDLNNETQVWKLKEGEKAVVNDDKREIIFK